MRTRGKIWLVPAAAIVVAVLLAPAGRTASPVQVILWHQEQPPHRVKVYQGIIDEFNKKNPGVRVTQQVQDWNLVYPKIAAAVRTNTQPDIQFTIPDFTTNVFQMGVIQPVDSLVTELDKRHGFLDAAKAPYRWDGKYWAIPLYGMVQMLWYRKDHFKAAGVSTAPKTWTELVAAAKKLTDKPKRYGIALPAGKNLASDQVIYSFMLTAGAGDFFDAQGNVVFNNPNTVRTFKLYKELLDCCTAAGAMNFSWGEPQALFNNGTVSMAIEKGQYLPPWEKDSGRPSADLGCTSIPQPAQGGRRGSIYYSNGAMILTKDSVKQKAAGQFIAYLLQPEVYGRFLNAEPGLFLPLTKDGATARSYLDHPVIKKYKPCVDLMFEESRYGALFGFTSGRVNRNIGKISAQNILAQTIQKMVAEGISPEDAVKWGHEQMERALRQ